MRNLLGMVTVNAAQTEMCTSALILTSKRYGGISLAEILPMNITSERALCLAKVLDMVFSLGM